MKNEVLQIKNMVCDRCKMSVSAILKDLNIPFRSVSLGEVVLERLIDSQERAQVQKEFKKVGFGLIDDRNEKLVNRIKSLIIEEIYQSQALSKKKLSEVLSTSLLYDYTYLSSLFKRMEKISIEKFCSNLKIERTKELLEYGELNINEIAAEIGYNSVSYFCTKFKKETGLTPLAYQKKHLRNRKGLNTL